MPSGEGIDWVQWLALAGGLSAVAAFMANRRDAARSDAAGVYVQVTLFQGAPAPGGSATFTRYKIVNNGQLPASSVGIQALDWGRRRLLWRLRRRKNWWTGDWLAGGAVYPIISPNSETDENELAGPAKWGPTGETHPLMLKFRDGQGREWVRWPDGKLTRLAPSLHQLERVWQQIVIARRLRRLSQSRTT
jgi:hypothetical protein